MDDSFGNASRETTTAEGPAFTIGVKALATLLMLGVAGFGAMAIPAMMLRPWSIAALALMALALACLMLCYVEMLRSRTTVTATHIRQSWVRQKQVALADIRQIKLIYIPGLAWLVAPRLVVRTQAPGSIVFHAGDARVLRALVQIALARYPPA